MRSASILISGIGIAGPALAYWLQRFGFAPTLVERAPQLRSEGYIIDFWGAGYDLTERMGLLPAILAAGYSVEEVRFVDARGRRAGGFDADVLREATFGRYTSLARGDLSAILYAALDGRAETIFGDSITALEQTADSVQVRFEHSAPRRFDLVIGADGLHGAVRALAFGPEARFERFLGYVVAAFEVEGYAPRDPDVYLGHADPGRQVTRFTLRGDRTMFLLVATEDAGRVFDPHDTQAHRQYLRDRFAGMGWECPQILDAMQRCDSLYFDRVSQIRMDHWSSGRIALLGDAAYAPSLLAGQGSALAIIGAYVLAGELARANRPEQAFAAYERLLHPFMRDKQVAAEGFAGAFTPRTRLGLFVRNQVTRAFALPFAATLFMRSSLVDRIDLPDYRLTNDD